MRHYEKKVAINVRLCKRRQLVPVLWGHPGSNICREYVGRCAVSLLWVCLLGAQMLTRMRCLWSILKARLCKRRQLVPVLWGHPGSNICREYAGRCAVSLLWACLWGAQMLTRMGCLWSREKVRQPAMMHESVPFRHPLTHPVWTVACLWSILKVRLCERLWSKITARSGQCCAALQVGLWSKRRPDAFGVILCWYVGILPFLSPSPSPQTPQPSPPHLS